MPPVHEDADTRYQYCNAAFPVGTALAQTWDLDLLREVGRAVACEMREFGVDLWLAPGMNIQRNPLCGRNFEYYAEEPLLSGCWPPAITQGVQEQGGCGSRSSTLPATTRRTTGWGWTSVSRSAPCGRSTCAALRIAIKEADPAAIMTSYNRINGVYPANSPDLCTALLRQEWGFGGLVMTDWNTTVPADGSTPWRCAAAGNDVIMPGNPGDDADIRHALAAGCLTEELSAAAPAESSLWPPACAGQKNRKHA